MRFRSWFSSIWDLGFGYKMFYQVRVWGKFIRFWRKFLAFSFLQVFEFGTNPVAAKTMDFSSLSRGQLTLFGSAFCTMASMHFTFQLLSQHLFYWKNPKEQKAIVIIILMAPLYALVSFVGLLDIKGSKTFFTFLESVKECYEALVSTITSWLYHLPMLVFI